MKNAQTALSASDFEVREARFFSRCGGDELVPMLRFYGPEKANSRLLARNTLGQVVRS